MNLEHFHAGGYLETDTGSIFLRTYGTGSPLIVIHGGPGMDHEYLLSLTHSISGKTLVFYDQPGCGKDRGNPSNANVNSVATQLTSLVKSIDSTDVTFLAHSWGAFVAIDFLRRNPRTVHPNSLILMNPCPLEKIKYDEVGSRLLARIPADVMTKIGEIMSGDSPKKGEQMMQIALPYYCGSDTDIPNLLLNYSEKTYNSVSASLGEFDLRSSVSLLPKATLLIYSDRDYIFPEDTQEMHSYASRIEILKHAGHFSFADQPQEFCRVVNSFFEDITVK